MKFKIFNRDGKLLQYKTEGSAGMDVRASIKEDIILAPGARYVIPTGLFIIIPESNMEIQVRSRSGLAIKHGICVVNQPGTIDSDYTGELLVGLINLSDEEFIIKDGDRVAQIVACPIIKMVTEDMTEEEHSSIKTARGDGKFGSTGIK